MPSKPIEPDEKNERRAKVDGKPRRPKTTPNIFPRHENCLRCELKVQKRGVEELDRMSRAKAYRLLGPIEKVVTRDCWSV